MSREPEKENTYSLKLEELERKMYESIGKYHRDPSVKNLIDRRFHESEVRFHIASRDITQSFKDDSPGIETILQPHPLGITEDNLKQLWDKASKSPRSNDLFPSTVDENDKPWPQPLKEFWNPRFMENIRINSEDLNDLDKEDLLKAMSEPGVLFINQDDKDIRWAVDQLKKGEVVRNSAWPPQIKGICMCLETFSIKIVSDIKSLIKEYTFTNQDVLFGDWEIV